MSSKIKRQIADAKPKKAGAKVLKMKMPDIDNEKLEQAMRGFEKEPGRESLSLLAAALKETELFVPAMAGPKQGGVWPHILKNKEGSMYMPAFTSIKKFPKDQQYQAMLRLPYRKCVSMLLDGPTLVQGIVLNPFSDNLMLKAQMLELSRKMEEQEKQPQAVTVKAEDFHMMMRHNAEFHLIPKKLYEKKLEFVQGLSEEVLCGLYQELYAGVGQEKQFVYTKDDFEMMELNIRADLHMIQIVPPSKKLYRTNCREIYIVWNPQTGLLRYYAVAKGAEDKNGQFSLDLVKEDDTWERLEDAPAEGNVISRIMEIFDAEQAGREENKD